MKHEVSRKFRLSTLCWISTPLAQAFACSAVGLVKRTRLRSPRLHLPGFRKATHDGWSPQADDVSGEHIWELGNAHGIFTTQQQGLEGGEVEESGVWWEGIRTESPVILAWTLGFLSIRWLTTFEICCSHSLSFTEVKYFFSLSVLLFNERLYSVFRIFKLMVLWLTLKERLKILNNLVI